MTGRTHTTIGILSTLLITQPSNIKDIALCVGVASVGSVISDVDVSRSKSRNKLNHIVSIMFVACIAIVLAELLLNIKLLQYIKQDSNIYRVSIGLLILLGVCIIGAKTPHRSFTHSFVGVGIISAISYFILPEIMPYMLVSMMSHIFVDLFNHRRVKLLYPLKSGLCFNLCKSNGVVNEALFIAGFTGSILYIILTFIIK